MKSQQPGNRVGKTRSGKRSFTLTEALVTAGALCLMIVCLVPAATVTRGSSKQSVCLNNLMRIGYANLIYAAQDISDPALPVHPGQYTQDPDDPIWVGAQEWGGKSGVGEPGFVDGPDGEDPLLTSRYGTKAGFGAGTRPLNKILYPDVYDNSPWPQEYDPAEAIADTQLDLDLYRCPSDNGYTGIHEPAFRDERRTAFDHFGTSYDASLFMISYIGGGPVWSNSPYLHRMAEIISPATTLAYQEVNGRFAWEAAPNNPDCASILGSDGIPGTVHGWHGKDWTFNVAFLDGHADTIYMRGFNNPRVLLDDYEQRRSTCIIVRGENWQKDTLPVEWAPTGLWWDGTDRVSHEGGVE